MTPHKLLAILVIVVVLLVIETLAGLGLNIGTLAPAFVALVYATYIGGLWAGLVGAVLVFAYHLWQMGASDPVRSVMVGLSVFSVTVMVGLLQRKARIVDTLNGNIIRLRQTIEQLDSLIGGWYIMSDPERRDRIREIRHNLSQLTTLVIGWHRLAQEKDEVAGMEGNDDGDE